MSKEPRLRVEISSSKLFGEAEAPAALLYRSPYVACTFVAFPKVNETWLSQLSACSSPAFLSKPFEHLLVPETFS